MAEVTLNFAFGKFRVIQGQAQSYKFRTINTFLRNISPIFYKHGHVPLFSWEDM